jgi:seryl-tRNA synthetase
VTEQTPSKSSLSIWERPALELLEKLLLAADLTPDLRKKLQPIVDRRRELGKIEEQLSGLTEKRNKLDQRASELRANIQAIEKNTQAAAQRQKWTKQLDDFTQEGNKLGAQLAELEAKRLDARNDLQDLLSDLDLTAPPAKKP